MKKFIILLLTVLLISCDSNKNQGDFINYNCNIPIIECIIDKDTMHLIVDTGAEYSIINQDYYRNNSENFTKVNTIKTQFSGIGGTTTQLSDIVGSYTSFGYITFVEQNLSAVANSMNSYNIVGLLGSDFFKNHGYIIDYNVRKIYHYSLIDSIYGKNSN